MTASRFSFPNESLMTTSNISQIQTEEDLTHVLDLCGLTSERLFKNKIDGYLPIFHEPLARRLADETLKNLCAAVNSNSLLIYSWIMRICELSREFDEDFLRERLILCADPERAPADASRGVH